METSNNAGLGTVECKADETVKEKRAIVIERLDQIDKLEGSKVRDFLLTSTYLIL
jgi:hypothetical protein